MILDLPWQGRDPLAFQTGIFTLPQPADTNGSAKLSNPTINQWFNTSAFYQPPPVTFGDSSRSVPNVRNPGIRNADLSLFRNTYSGKENRYNMQFRVEAFNSLNDSHWGGPNTHILAGSSFGAITSDTGPRNAQLALKFLW